MIITPYMIQHAYQPKGQKSNEKKDLQTKNGICDGLLGVNY